MVRALEFRERPILVLDVSERHDRDIPSRDEEVGHRPVMAESGGDRRARLARDVASRRDHERAGRLFAATTSVEASVGSQPPENYVLSSFPEEAVVSPV